MVATGEDSPAERFSLWWDAQWSASPLVSNLAAFPEPGSAFHYYLQPGSSHFVPWRDMVLQELSVYSADPATPLGRVFVPQLTSCRVTYFMDMLLRSGCPTLVVGPAGCGKTVAIQSKLDEFKDERYMSIEINLNYFSDSKLVQETIEQVLEKRAGRIYGPPSSKKLMCFINDLNMPAVDQFGTQSAIELLLQHLGYGQWYERDHALYLVY